jgi:hypothetical protein
MCYLLLISRLRMMKTRDGRLEKSGIGDGEDNLV